MTALLAVGIPYLVKLFRFWRQGIKVKQLKLWNYGRWLALIGCLIMIGLPKILGIQYNLSDAARVAYILVTLVGFCLLVIGFRFSIASYNTQEKTPGWVKQLLTFWE